MPQELTLFQVERSIDLLEAMGFDTDNSETLRLLYGYRDQLEREQHRQAAQQH